MKATGVVRRIDDLGRIVLPKELRRTMMTLFEINLMHLFIGYHQWLLQIMEE